MLLYGAGNEQGFRGVRDHVLHVNILRRAIANHPRERGVENREAIQ
ncbi:hypothetical protein GCM10027038_31410 [Arthrobacter bambusae]